MTHWELPLGSNNINNCRFILSAGFGPTALVATLRGIVYLLEI